MIKHELDVLLREQLEKLITPNKKRHIDRVLESRTRHLTVVLENLHKPHNASAVLRTIECFGIQDYYIIESKKQYKISPHVAKGAGKWVDIHRFNQAKGDDTQKCIEHLRKNGYIICATSPKAPDSSLKVPFQLENVPLVHKMAIFFGNELNGLSDVVLQEADLLITLPMWGFTESYNVSVSAALTFYSLLKRLENSDLKWKLDEKERQELRMQWYRKIITRAETIEKELVKTLTNNN